MGCLFKHLSPILKQVPPDIQNVGEREISYVFHTASGRAMLRANGKASVETGSNLTMFGIYRILSRKGAKSSTAVGAKPFGGWWSNAFWRRWRQTPSKTLRQPRQLL